MPPLLGCQNIAPMGLKELNSPQESNTRKGTRLKEALGLPEWALVSLEEISPSSELRILEPTQ